MNQNIRKTSVWFDTVGDTRRYPMLEGQRTADIVVIGGGIVGITAVCHLVREGKKVILLEKNHIGTGDSGLTTGFITRPIEASVSDLESRYGLSFIQRIFKGAAEIQTHIIDKIKEESIDCDFLPCDSWYGSYGAGDAVLKEEWKHIQTADIHATWETNADITSTPFVEAIRFSNEGKFHLRKYLFELLKRMPKDHTDIFEESEVTEIISREEGVRVETENGTITAKSAIVAIGHPGLLFPELQSLVQQKITSVIGLEVQNPPIKNDIYWDTFEPYFYYRMVGDDTLILGGCDMDVADVSSQKPFDTLMRFAQKHFGGGQKITHEWSGSIFVTDDHVPYVFEHPHCRNVFIGTGWGGTGIVFGSFAAHILADLALGHGNPYASLFALSRTGRVIEKPLVKKEVKSNVRQFVPVEKISDTKKTVSCHNVNGKKIALFSLRDTWYAIDNTCTHAGGSLCDGTFEDGVVQCPLHGAKFDVTTGAVVAPPAVREVRTYKTRVVNGVLEVEIDSESREDGTTKKRREETIKKERRARHHLLYLFSLGALVFWFTQFGLQFFWLTKDELGGSLVRSFALTGATLIGAALFSSAMFKWFPKTARHWRIRRYLGVSGFIFISFHVLAVLKYLFNFDVNGAYYSFNPFENPIIFGSIAFPILFVMAATSTDWAVDKLTPKRWKFIHRFIYIAYASAIFHFILINPELLKNPPGILLLVITSLAVLGQLYWYIHTAFSRKFKNRGTYVGLLIIIAIAWTGWHAFKIKFMPTVSDMPLLDEESLDASIENMKAFMKEYPKNSDILETPFLSDASFNGKVLQQGSFQNINYMSTGGVSLQEKDGGYVIVFDDNFETPKGPDLQVYLTPNVLPTEREDIRRGIPLGKLKSTTGKQIYPIPQGTPIDAFHSVTIHCKAFNVPWSYAPLQK